MRSWGGRWASRWSAGRARWVGAHPVGWGPGRTLPRGRYQGRGCLRGGVDGRCAGPGWSPRPARRGARVQGRCAAGPALLPAVGTGTGVERPARGRVAQEVRGAFGGVGVGGLGVGRGPGGPEFVAVRVVAWRHGVPERRGRVGRGRGRGRVGRAVPVAGAVGSGHAVGRGRGGGGGAVVAVGPCRGGAVVTVARCRGASVTEWWRSSRYGRSRQWWQCR